MPEDDLMIHYTTSSATINDLLKEHGIDAFEWEVRQTFDTPEQAIAWEQKVLLRCNVLKNQHIWLNGNVAGYKVTTPAGRKKISETHKDKPKTEEHKKNLSESQKGKPKKSTVYQSQEYRENMSKLKSGSGNAMFGKPCSPERAANISNAKKGKPAKNKGVPMTEEQCKKVSQRMAETTVYLTCPVCDKTMGHRHYKMYGHGDECKMMKCPHCNEYHAKTKYDTSHGDKCKFNPNREKPFIPRSQLSYEP